MVNLLCTESHLSIGFNSLLNTLIPHSWGEVLSGVPTEYLVTWKIKRFLRLSLDLTEEGDLID